MREYIDAVFDKYGFPEAREFVEKDLKSGKCIILLDGFDELAARENQEKVTKEVRAFVKQYHRCRVVVTSRVAGYHDELTGFKRVEVMDFDDQQIKRFVGNWFGGANRKKVESMLKAVMGNENIKALAKNPLMISIIAIIYEEGRELPQRRIDLYKRTIDVVLNRWDIGKNLKNRFNSAQKEFILRKLAFKCHCRNLRVMQEAEILEEIGKYSDRLGLKEKEVKPFLEEIWQRSYLLRQVAMDTYDFLHLSFQEYFTALELKEQEDGIGTIIEHIAEPWWEEPILLYVGRSNDAGPLIKRIQKRVPEDIFYSNLILFGKCIADAEFTDPAIKEEIVQNLWNIYENEKFPLLIDRVIEVVQLIKPPHIVDFLVNQLKSCDYEVRMIAVKAIGAIGGTKVVDVLAKVLSNDNERIVRESAAKALGVIGSTEAIDVLLKALSTDKESSIRGIAAGALRRIGSAAVVPHLLHALKYDKYRYVRKIAAIALQDIGNIKGLSSQFQTVMTDKDSYVRGRAAETLGVIGGNEAVPALLQALNSDMDGSVRGRTAEALGNIKNDIAIQTLKHVLESKEEVNDVKNKAFEALYKISRRLGVRILREQENGKIGS